MTSLTLCVLLVIVEQTHSVSLNNTIRMGYLVSYKELGGAINVAIENAQNDGLLRDYNFRYALCPLHILFTTMISPFLSVHGHLSGGSLVRVPDTIGRSVLIL